MSSAKDPKALSSKVAEIMSSLAKIPKRISIEAGALSKICESQLSWAEMQLYDDVDQIIIKVCLITPRTYPDVKRAFMAYLRSCPYSALDLAKICHAQAMADAPMPWEPGYERHVLEDIFIDKTQSKLDLMDLLTKINHHAAEMDSGRLLKFPCDTA